MNMEGFSPAKKLFICLFPRVTWAMESGHLLWALLFMQPLWPQLTDGTTRVYYLGIQDVRWNYAPKGRNIITNQPLESDIVAASFLKSDKNRIGNSYKKTIYKEYKDGSYMDEMVQPAWLGFLGPVLRAEVGDVILIHLKNFATRPYTIHPHGVFYEKDSEGSLYPDGSSGWLKADDSVPPGGSHIYNWTIPEGHAPTDADPACLTWVYHSHVDAPRDIATGLIGPLITCKRGTLDGSFPPRRQDVDNDFFLLFSVIDENLSWHINENIATYCSDPASVDKEDEDFQKSNRMHGPVIRAEVGDTILVIFYNRASQPFSIQPHGVFYEKDSEGTVYNDDSSHSGLVARPFEKVTYRWTVPPHAGPTVQDPACLTWTYFSAADPIRDTNSGLVGPLLVCKAGTLGTDGKQKGVDKEFFLLFTVLDENKSWYSNANQAAAMLDSRLLSEDAKGFQDSNRMHGTFEIYCQAGSHREAGMRAIYNVSLCPGHQANPHQRYQAARIYYIMAEEMEWDYCPDRSWELEWHNQSEKDSYGHIFLSNKDGLLGSRYKKAVFREYTDGTFRVQRPRTGSEEHLGILGPLIRGEVGDILTVVFKNNASRPYSVHAHGVLESSTGWPLAAEPGEVLTYQWNIPERSGPGLNDSACVSWIYYSAVDPIKDMYSGLVGPLAICRKGILEPYGGRRDMNREFALLFLIFDENKSWYLEENVETYGSQDPGRVNLQDETFLESNKMHAINGKLYANLMGLTMYQGERVAWYMMAMGQDIDLHTVHFHAESFLYRSGESYRADVVDLFPGTFEVVEMVASNPGTWLLHCHVTDHVHAGMETVFTVLSQREHLSTTTTIPEEIGKVAIPRNIGEGSVKMLGMQIPIKDIEMLTSVLIAMGVILLLIALVLGGVVWYQHRQRKLRRNRRSILDDSFKLLSLKQ
uniref:ferroxidase n=2 Tax=Bos indicus x Bos taurus TaxID=30522 RepID=A0A4W2FWK2_BOBOX